MSRVSFLFRDANAIFMAVQRTLSLKRDFFTPVSLHVLLLEFLFYFLFGIWQVRLSVILSFFII